jgi:hypothetical protein
LNRYQTSQHSALSSGKHRKFETRVSPTQSEAKTLLGRGSSAPGDIGCFS